MLTFILMQTRAFGNSGTVPLMDMVNTGNVADTNAIPKFFSGTVEESGRSSSEGEEGVALSGSLDATQNGAEVVGRAVQEEEDTTSSSEQPPAENPVPNNLDDEVVFSENSYHCLAATKRIRAGEEILNDYGQNDRRRFGWFAQYAVALPPEGFTKPELPASVAETRHFCSNVLSREVVRQHNIWESKDPVAWNLARWAELNCEGAVRVVEEAGFSGEVGGAGGQHDEMGAYSLDQSPLGQAFGPLRGGAGLYLAAPVEGNGGAAVVEEDGAAEQRHTALRTTKAFERGEPVLCVERKFEEQFAARFTRYWAGDSVPEEEEATRKATRKARKAFFLARRLSLGAGFTQTVSVRYVQCGSKIL